MQKKFIFSGTVQGVGFRYTTYRIALNYNITGWVKNLPDGTVEVIACGNEKEIKEFINIENEEFTNLKSLQKKDLMNIKKIENVINVLRKLREELIEASMKSGGKIWNSPTLVPTITNIVTYIRSLLHQIFEDEKLVIKDIRIGNETYKLEINIEKDLRELINKPETRRIASQIVGLENAIKELEEYRNKFTNLLRRNIEELRREDEEIVRKLQD